MGGCDGAGAKSRALHLRKERGGSRAIPVPPSHLGWQRLPLCGSCSVMCSRSSPSRAEHGHAGSSAPQDTTGSRGQTRPQAQPGL